MTTDSKISLDPGCGLHGDHRLYFLSLFGWVKHLPSAPAPPSLASRGAKNVDHCQEKSQRRDQSRTGPCQSLVMNTPPSQWSLTATSMEEQMRQNYSENVCLLYSTAEPSYFMVEEKTWRCEFRENSHFFPLPNHAISIHLQLFSGGGGRETSLCIFV